ncbi:hypothetical protein [Vibrio sp. SCSIO 43136]|uniref:hypothetical protein n=1 Tax=Vibrio sp. SCSIO 43136 TaxID=2819101 RepID=UPI002076413D|nr:hypothetical protein [Vibrio sp. SCSIO 43136]USD67889.1 hypothetical protein J4N39_17035 [Vibrio sp. SCSIO 43136]
MTNSNSGAIHFMCVVASLAILVANTQFLMGIPSADGFPWLGLVLAELTRFAPPLLFTLIGYVLAEQLTHQPISTFKHYAKAALQLWLVWSLIGLILPIAYPMVIDSGYLAERSMFWDTYISQPQRIFLVGGSANLWVFPAFVSGLAVIALCVKQEMTKQLPLIAGGLYLFGLIGDAYSPLSGLHWGFESHHGPFMSTLMMVIGMHMRCKRQTMPLARATAVMLMGLTLHMGEGVLLHSLGSAFYHPMLLGTVVWVSGAFCMLSLMPCMKKPARVFENLAKLSLAIYLVGYLAANVAANLVYFVGLSDFLRDVFVLTTTILLTFGAISLLSNTPAKQSLRIP